MKKFAAIIAICLIVSSINAQESSNSLLHRTNLELGMKILPSTNFNFGGGFLKYHPERSLDLTASVNIWEYFMVGATLSLQGASSTGFSGTTSFSKASDIDFYYIGWDDNKYHLSGGVMIEAHTIPFSKRYMRNNLLGFFAHAGWGLGGQVDGFWFGFGEELRLSRQLVFSLSLDYGSFPFAYLIGVADNESSWRVGLGLKFSLR